MKKIRFTAIIVAALLVLSLFAGCAAKADPTGSWKCDCAFNASDLITDESMPEANFTVEMSFDLAVKENNEYDMTAEINMDKLRDDFVDYFNDYIAQLAQEQGVSEADMEAALELVFSQSGYESIEDMIDQLLVAEVAASAGDFTESGKWSIDGDTLSLVSSAGGTTVGTYKDGKITFDTSAETDVPVDSLVFEKQ